MSRRRRKDPNFHLENALCKVIDAGLQDQRITLIQSEAAYSMYVRSVRGPDELVFKWWKDHKAYYTESRVIGVEKALDLIKKNWNQRCATTAMVSKTGTDCPEPRRMT